MIALVLATFVANVSDGNALTLPAQRHLVQVGGTTLLALQQGGADGRGLGFFRSDDGGGSWSWYAPIQDDAGHTDRADLLAVGSDVALVYSFEGPTLYGSSRHDVWFQWWRASGSDWSPSGAVRVFQSPGDSGGYYRAELAIDSNGYIWVQAFRIEDGGGATAAIAVSTDGGNSFAEQPSLGYVGARGGGRILSLGSSLIFLYGSHGCCDPGRMLTRNDSDPLYSWSGPSNAIPDGLYHGAALSAVADGGGMHLVYKSLGERMYYRYFNGGSFSDPQLVEDVPDWATQASTTLVGSSLVICYNHPVSSGTDYRFYRRTVDGGLVGDAVSLDDSGGFKGYPTALAAASSAPMCMVGRTPDANSSGAVELVQGGY